MTKKHAFPKKANVTPTVRHLLNSPSSELLRTTDVGLTEGRFSQSHRLCFENVSPKQRIDYERVAWFIREFNPSNMSFYLDTNFFTGEEKPDNLWNALLEKRIVITPLIWQELQPWLANPFRNRRMRDVLLDAQLNKSVSIQFDPGRDWHPFVSLAHSYYANLLGMRKRMARIYSEQFLAEHDREATDDELDALIQRHAADHEFRLAKKGKNDIHKDTFLADEELVAFASLEAIDGNSEATILTTDTDVQVQFVKMMTILDQQYQAFLFAERFAVAPESFQMQPLVRSTPELLHYFADDDGMLVAKPCNPGREFVEWLLPTEYRANPIYCLLFGGSGEQLVFSPLSYSAEHDMLRMLMKKGETSGMNTDTVGEANCHVTGFPVGIEDARKWVIIAKDVVIEKGGIKYARSDIARANFERGERAS